MTLSILGIGSFLPPEVRRNDAWAPSIVEKWSEARAFSPDRAKEAVGIFAEDAGAARIFEEMAKLSNDPFQGSIERRVMSPGMSAVDMETAAAKLAIEEAGISLGEIDFVMGSSLVPDYINATDACGVHAALGLSADCFVLSADAVCNSFQYQIALADALIAKGKFKKGLLVQGAASSRITPMEAPFSVNFGDGATAVVVGEGQRRQLVSQVFETDTSLYRSLVATVPGTDWWEPGRIIAHPLDKDAARRMIPVAPEVARRLIHRLLEEQNLTPDAVDFFACHQATVWFRRVVQAHAGLNRADFVDTFLEAGSLSAANLPLVLDRAKQKGKLHDGMLVATFQAGTGATYGASLFRW